MRQVEKRLQIDRRLFLRGAASAVPAAAVLAAGVGTAGAAWADDAKALKQATLVTLAHMARDIYPHDQIPDRFYVAAVTPFDAKAQADDAMRLMYEDGVARLNGDAQDRFKTAYIDVPEESDRVVLLTEIELTPFFGHVRGGLVVSLYNQPEIWHRFGYEGSSSEFGGYLHRGFNDIDWLPAV